MNETCGNCKFCAVDPGYPTGHCHALPPPRYQDGRHYGTSSQPPQVQIKTRGCVYHQPVAEGESNVRGKNQDGLNREFRIAHRDLPSQPIDPVGLLAKDVLKPRARNGK